MASEAMWAAWRRVRDFVDDEVSSRMEAGGEETDYLLEAKQAAEDVESFRALLQEEAGT